MNLEDTILSEISQTQMNKYCMIPLILIFRMCKFIETERKIDVTKGWKKGEGGVIVLMFTEFFLGVMKKSGV